MKKTFAKEKSKQKLTFLNPSIMQATNQSSLCDARRDEKKRGVFISLLQTISLHKTIHEQKNNSVNTNTENVTL